MLVSKWLVFFTQVIKLVSGILKVVKSTICSCAMAHLGMASIDDEVTVKDLLDTSKEIVVKYLYSSLSSGKYVTQGVLKSE